MTQMQYFNWNGMIAWSNLSCMIWLTKWLPKMAVFTPKKAVSGSDGISAAA